ISVCGNTRVLPDFQRPDGLGIPLCDCKNSNVASIVSGPRALEAVEFLSFTRGLFGKAKEDAGTGACHRSGLRDALARSARSGKAMKVGCNGEFTCVRTIFVQTDDCPRAEFPHSSA